MKNHLQLILDSKFWRKYKIMSKANRIVIIGAGFAGREIAAEISSKGILGEVVAFLDDAPDKIGTEEQGIPILGPINKALPYIKEIQADEALIAIPGAEKSDLRRIYTYLQNAELKRIRILPNVSQIIEGDAHLIQTREIKAQDLLARKPVHIGLVESLEYLRGKRVLITGAGGSIGSELARQLLSGGADRLYLFDHGENNVYEIDRELRILQEGGVGEASTIVPIVGELQDRDFVRFIISRLKADVIFHCAAYKHVPLTEENPVEGVKNNIFGTKNIVDAAKEFEVSKFVFISTDKAVSPVCVYGASKLVAEELVLNSNSKKTDFMVVRFGNVLGSRGSIVPLFTRQIMKGGPVTITHKNVKRFFMTIPEAASLVLKTGGVGTGGTLYILEMGKPILIRDLAEQMIKFYGYLPEKEIKIIFTGLRPGEKLDERLWTEEDTVVATKHPGIIKVLHRSRLNGQLEEILEKLYIACFLGEEKEKYRNRIYLRKVLHEYIPSIGLVNNEPEY